MAKFCSNCGRPLQEGEVCTCQTQSGQPNQGQPYGQQGQPYGQPNQGQFYGQQGQPYGQPQPQPQAPKQPGAAGIYIKELWGSIVGAYKKPAETLSGMTVNPKAPVLWGLLGIQAILFSLIFLFMGLKMNGLTGGYITLINTPLAFFMALILGAAILAVWGAVAMAFAKAVAKKPMTYSQGLGAAAAKAVAQMPFTVVTALFVLILPVSSGFAMGLIMFIYSAGTLLSYFFIPVSMEAFLAEDKNKRVWQLFLTFVVNMVVSYVAAWIFLQIIGSGMASALTGGLF